MPFPTLFSIAKSTLSPQQLQTLKENYCDMILDNMDMDDLMVMCYDLLMDSYEKLNEEEVKAEILDLYDQDTLDSLMPKVSPSQARDDLYSQVVAYNENYDDL